MTSVNWTRAHDGAYTATVTARDGTVWYLTAWWDDQDSGNEGWAFRARCPETGEEHSGPADDLADAQEQALDCLPR